MWDSTSLTWLKECPRKYYYQMIRGLRRRSSTSAHLIFGQHYHAALELYDHLKAQQGADFSHDDACAEVLVDLLRRTWERQICVDCDGGANPPDLSVGCTSCYNNGYVNQGPWEADHPAKNRLTLVRSVMWYLDEFKDDPAETIILANGKPAVELTFKFDSGIPVGEGFASESAGHAPLTYTLSGHLDRVARFAGDAYVFDRKTSSSALTSHFFDSFNPNTQFSLYTLAGQFCFGIPLAGVLIDGAQIGVGFTRFGRGFSPRTPGQLEEFLAELPYWFGLAENFAAQGHWPKNEASCNNYGGCPFRRICSIDPSARERFLESEFEVSRWNPAKER